MEKNWREIYDFLVADMTSPADYTVEQLFELASWLAVNGDFTGKKRVYTEFIFNHPQVSADDQCRVQTYTADLVRREGSAETALGMLEEIGQPNGGIACLEWLQAKGQCYLMLEDYPSAIACQREIIGLLDDTVSVDLRFYYLQGLVHIKLCAGGADEEARRLLAQMEQLLARPDFPASKLAYSQVSYLQLLGRWYGDRKDDLPAAIMALCKAYEIRVSPREQAVTAMLALYYQFRYGTEVPDWECDMILCYLKNQGAFLQPTDRAQYRKFHEFVSEQLGLSD